MTPTNSDLAARLRAMANAIQPAGCNSPSGTPLLKITFTGEWGLCMLQAAEALEKAAEARQQAQIDRHDAIAARDRARIDLGREFREQLREAARDTLGMEYGGITEADSKCHEAIRSLCRRLGVEL